ncbi:hypothetical protein SAFG77S_08049 [Streptomyces afghaniensis]
MTEFKMSAQLQALIANKEEAEKKQAEKRVNIEALNETQQVLLAKKSNELQEVINKYAEDPNEELEVKLTELEKEVAQLQAKVASARNRSSTVFSADTSVIRSLKNQIDTLAEAEYMAHYNKNKDELYTKIGDAKNAYLNALAQLHDLKRSTNLGYMRITGAESTLVGLNESDFFYSSGTYRPLGITDKEITDALKNGESKDNWDRPYVNQLNN